MNGDLPIPPKLLPHALLAEHHQVSQHRAAVRGGTEQRNRGPALRAAAARLPGRVCPGQEPSAVPTWASPSPRTRDQGAGGTCGLLSSLLCHPLEVGSLFSQKCPKRATKNVLGTDRLRLVWGQRQEFAKMDPVWKTKVLTWHA